MGYDDLILEHMRESDGDHNGFLDSLEWLGYLNRNKTFPSAERKKELDEQR